jgi:cytochrome c
MPKILLSAMVVAILFSGCGEKPTSPPTPQTSAADRAMENSREEAQAAAHDARQLASESARAAKDAAAAAVIATRQAAADASATAKSVTDRLASAGAAADQAATAARENAQRIASAVRNSTDEAADASVPTTMPDWIRMPTYDCRACHDIDRRLVGPAWRDVAERYKDNPQAETFLIDKVRAGGKGNWDAVTGGAPMPPHPSLSDAELKRVVDFVLSLSPHHGDVILNRD